MSISSLNLDTVNKTLANSSPSEIIAWALSLNKNTIMTTSFGFYSAVSLHALVSTEGGEDIPVVWVDSGYNVRDAYQTADQLTQRLKLNLKVYNPLMSSERRNAIMGGAPAHGEPLFDEFVRQVKLEPFERALNELQPEIWITGIRKEETEHRRNLDIVTIDDRGIIKVAPLFHRTEADLEAYLEKYNLPNCAHYFDPTKVQDHLECGLHTFTSLKPQ
ncbi:MAG: phosphoadenosine phosphosulfate reductase family protein [Cellvibrionales bacterium]|nr:phosphoadenosine phosphosulfate reductase family protein [Cellvibrionales bacterium]